MQNGLSSGNHVSGRAFVSDDAINWQRYGRMFGHVLNTLTDAVAKGQTEIIWVVSSYAKMNMQWISAQAESVGIKATKEFEGCWYGSYMMHFVKFDFKDLLARLRAEKASRNRDRPLVRHAYKAPENSAFTGGSWFPEHIELMILYGLPGLAKTEAAKAAWEAAAPDRMRAKYAHIFKKVTENLAANIAKGKTRTIFSLGLSTTLAERQFIEAEAAKLGMKAWYEVEALYGYMWFDWAELAKR